MHKHGLFLAKIGARITEEAGRCFFADTRHHSVALGETEEVAKAAYLDVTAALAESAGKLDEGLWAAGRKASVAEFQKRASALRGGRNE